MRDPQGSSKFIVTLSGDEWGREISDDKNETYEELKKKKTVPSWFHIL